MNFGWSITYNAIMILFDFVFTILIFFFIRNLIFHLIIYNHLTKSIINIKLYGDKL